MTFLENLQSHKGGLIRLKTELYWYNRGWDGVPDRVCLVLDASAAGARPAAVAGVLSASTGAAAALLLIDDRPQWIWVSREDVELL